MAHYTVRLRVSFPWWWPIYWRVMFYTAATLHLVAIPIDIDALGAAIARQARKAARVTLTP